jgi:hypothetical protein
LFLQEDFMKKLISLVTMLFVISAGTCLAAPAAPEVSYSLNGLNITVDWNSVPDATGYTLYYAPYPYAGPETIGSLGMKSATSFSIDLWDGAAYYIAVKASNNHGGESGYSNIEQFTMGPLSHEQEESYPQPELLLPGEAQAE